MKRVTICVCTYGDNLHLISRCVSSILGWFDRSLYEFRIGCNSCPDNLINFLNNVNVDKLIISKKNLHKNGMMKLLYQDITTDYIFWFDDDSYVINNCLENLIYIADNSNKDEAIFGSMGSCPILFEIEQKMGINNWIKKQVWYKGKSWPNRDHKYEENMQGFYFVRGGNYFAKSKAIKEVQWPSDPTGFLFDYSRNGEDIIMCEAIHQNDYKCCNIGINYGVVIGDSPTRCSD